MRRSGRTEKVSTGGAVPVQLILASASPRRAHLLDRLFLSYRICPADIDESFRPGESIVEHIQRLARSKAATQTHTELPVLAADTLVVLNDEILGKPRHETDAVDMLCKLSGRMHTVYTGVCVANLSRSEEILSVSKVYFREIERSEAKDYWATGEPADKAGGYGIQGVGNIFVRRIEGSYSGIMGLPLCESEQLLREFGIDTWQHRMAGKRRS